MNALTAIYPYKYEGLWVFDDPKVGLVQEPFVSGADVIIDRMTLPIPNAEKGFRLLFSATPFPGFTAQLDWRRADLSGNWYYSRDLDTEGWLCPALLKYFDAPPKTIYARFESKVG
jgi:hypothetical protein